MATVTTLTGGWAARDLATTAGAGGRSALTSRPIRRLLSRLQRPVPGKIEPRNKNPLAIAGFLLPLSVLVLATVMYGAYGFDGPLYRDYGIYLYGGQRMAAGVPPYAGIFDHKGPLPQMLAGLGVALSGWLKTDDLYAVRTVFFAAGCLATVAVYLLGESAFRSRTVGLLGALTFLGFYGFARPVASGPEPKTPMVLFEALSLVLLIRKRWFWAGLCGSLSFLAWQPTGVLPLVGFLIAVFQPREERSGATMRVLAGIASPLAVTGAYYWYHGALGDLLNGLVLFNVLHVHRGGEPPFLNPMGIVSPVIAGYGVMVVPILIGLGAVSGICFLRPYRYRFVPMLLSLPVFVVWSAIDFQVPEDLYVFLPYAAVGFGAALALVVDRGDRSQAVPVLVAVVLLAAAFTNVPALNGGASPGPSLQEQERSAAEIRGRFGADARIVSINAPQVLALLHEKNPNPYLFITDGIDREIAATTPGGFEGWVGELKAYRPEAISYFADAQRQMPDADLTPAHRRELYAWLDSEYHPEKIGNFWLYVRNSPGKGPAG